MSSTIMISPQKCTIPHFIALKSHVKPQTWTASVLLCSWCLWCEGALCSPDQHRKESPVSLSCLDHFKKVLFKAPSL